MASVRLEGIRKVYQEGPVHVAVEDASFEVNDGELVVLVGPSGSGKSTLLRMIAGLESISDGQLYIGDRLVNNVAPRDRDIAMVFQSYALYPHMSVYNNLGFGLQLKKIPRPEIDRRVRAAAAVLGIEGILDRKPRQLSGGQRQRVAVGRAIVRDPQVFLFDEPLSNLDAKLRVQTRTEIAALHRRLEATMIYVTHDQVEAMTLGDRIVVLHEGRIQQIDTPLNLYNHPTNRFVAGFIGSPAMNFLEGTLISDTGPEFRSRDDILRVALPDGWSQPSGATILGIRPENLHAPEIRPAGVPLAEASFIVETVEPLGNEIFIHAQAGGQRVTARVPPQTLPTPGEPISLAFDLSKIHLFDPQTDRSVPLH